MIEFFLLFNRLGDSEANNIFVNYLQEPVKGKFYVVFVTGTVARDSENHSLQLLKIFTVMLQK